LVTVNYRKVYMKTWNKIALGCIYLEDQTFKYLVKCIKTNTGGEVEYTKAMKEYSW
jgi:hypothetical protein